jgi:hypothetical protein
MIESENQAAPCLTPHFTYLRLGEEALSRFPLFSNLPSSKVLQPFHAITLFDLQSSQGSSSISGYPWTCPRPLLCTVSSCSAELAVAPAGFSGPPNRV